jgi:hypothetical protein
MTALAAAIRQNAEQAQAPLKKVFPAGAPGSAAIPAIRTLKGFLLTANCLIHLNSTVKTCSILRTYFQG